MSAEVEGKLIQVPDSSATRRFVSNHHVGQAARSTIPVHRVAIKWILPPNYGNGYKPFVDLIRLEEINDVTCRSIALPVSPGGDLPGTYDRAYGGHVYAQAAWVAC